MLFNSIEFLIFLPTVFVLYWFVTATRLRVQNLLVLGASYLFYGWWDWRFLGLIILSTLVDYIVGIFMHGSGRQSVRRIFLWVSLITNLGLLGYFKYFNFFLDSWIDAWASLGVTMHPATLQIILPVGISFYTFQTLSYTIDIYRRRIEPTRDFVAFAAFVAFFPQLVAGPIERAANLLPQFLKEREFCYRDAVEGLRQIIWGLFKKLVIADQLAGPVDQIFAGFGSQPGSVLLFGTALFAFQIYCDFSGYSDIAIGTARLFGFRLMTNFKYPYFSRDIAEYWRRWHISLSTWVRDYLYIPMGGSRGTKAVTLRNIVIVFTVSGFWHGANWTYGAWGLLNGLYFLPFILRDRHRRYMDDAAPGRMLPDWRELNAILITFLAACLAYVFFRAENMQHAFAFLERMFLIGSFWGWEVLDLLPSLGLVALLVCFEWAYRTKPFPLSYPTWPAWVRRSVYFVLLYWSVISSKKATEFIYFQF